MSLTDSTKQKSDGVTSILFTFHLKKNRNAGNNFYLLTRHFLWLFLRKSYFKPEFDESIKTALETTLGPYLLGLFILFQFGDVLFSKGTLSPLQNSPATWVYEVPKYNAIFEGGSLNRFFRNHPNIRAFWDRPQVNDPNIKASNDFLFSGEFPLLNPYLGLGTPLFANGEDSTFFVGALLMGMVNSIYWDWIYLGFFSIGGWMLFCVFHRAYHFEKSAAFIGTVVFLSSGLFPPQMSNGGGKF